MLGTREAAKLAGWGLANPDGRVGSFAHAARFGEFVALAVKGSAALDALGAAGAEHLAGKTVIDATNPLADVPPSNGVLRYFTGPNESLMERLQSVYPNVRFVKAFNQIGNADMIDPKFGGGRPTMFICGNDAAAKAAVTDLLQQVGWEVEDFGGVEAARAIEPLCMLWCIRGFAHGQWHHAFKLLK
jgi:hypothetical protein